MKELSYDDFYLLDVTNREDAPSGCDFYCGCDPMVLNKGDLQHMMKGKLLNYSDDGEYGHYLKLSDDAIEWLKGLTDVSD